MRWSVDFGTLRLQLEKHETKETGTNRYALLAPDSLFWAHFLSLSKRAASRVTHFRELRIFGREYDISRGGKRIILSLRRGA